jgi:hypothetical protein
MTCVGLYYVCVRGRIGLVCRSWSKKCQKASRYALHSRVGLLLLFYNSSIFTSIVDGDPYCRVESGSYFSIEYALSKWKIFFLKLTKDKFIDRSRAYSSVHSTNMHILHSKIVCKKSNQDSEAVKEFSDKFYRYFFLNFIK